MCESRSHLSPSEGGDTYEYLNDMRIYDPLVHRGEKRMDIYEVSEKNVRQFSHCLQ